MFRRDMSAFLIKMVFYQSPLSSARIDTITMADHDKHIKTYYAAKMSPRILQFFV